MDSLQKVYVKIGKLVMTTRIVCIGLSNIIGPRLKKLNDGRSGDFIKKIVSEHRREIQVVN